MVVIILDLNNFDTSSVNNMTNMFFSCSSVKSLYLKDFDTSSVKAMESLFSGCTSLISLDLRNFNTTSVTNFKNVFLNCNPNLIYCFENTNTINNLISFMSTTYPNKFSNNCSMEFFDIIEINIDTTETLESTFINKVYISNSQNFEEFYIGTSEINNINIVSETNYQNKISTNLEEFNSITSEITNINIAKETNYQNEVSTHLEEVDTTTINESPRLNNEIVFKEVILENKPITTENGTTMHGYSVEDNIDDLVKQFPNLTFVYLGECGEKLKNAYGLSSDEKLFVLIEDMPNLSNKSSINYFDFDVYLENGTQLKNLSACNDVKITGSFSDWKIKFQMTKDSKDQAY